MEYAIKTPAGTITVDHECTMDRLKKQLNERGVKRVHAKAVFPASLHATETRLIAAIAKLNGITPDEQAARMAGQLLPSQRQTGAIAMPR